MDHMERTKLVGSSLCGCSNMYIFAKGTITFENTAAQGQTLIIETKSSIL